MSRSLKSRASGIRLASFFLGLSLVAVSSFAYPTSRTLSGMTYDESVRRVVLFGGLTGPDSSGIRYALNDTWQFTGRRWVLQAPAHRPTPRAGMVMVYDTHNERTLIFGGFEGETFYNDVWQYKDGDWSLVNTTGTAPSARRLAAAAFDPKMNRLYVYGGATAEDTLTDTWVLDVTSDTWSRVSENTPALRVGATMAYGSARDELILVGANKTTGTAETYRWSGSAWTKLSPATHPACVAQGALVDQRHTGRLVQVGGVCFSGETIVSRTNETWTWDGTNWTKDASNTTPGQVFGHAIAYDARVQNVIIFGGVDVEERQMTYAYRDRWKAVFVVAATPGPRSLAVGALDPLTREVILYGGLDRTLNHFDFWRRSRDLWSEIGARPPSCSYPAGSLDTDRKQFVIVCEGGSVSEWNGSEWKTYKDFDDDEQPPIRRLSSVAYDPVSKKTYLFGGYELNVYYREMWAWNGTSWEEVETGGSKTPTSRMLSTMFFDPHTQKIMIFGGIGRKTSESSVIRYDDMWSFNGSTFTPLTPSTKPAARYGASVAVAPARTVDGVERPARVLMFGGKSAEEKYLNELWEWTGTTWTKVETVNTPSARMNGTFVFDELNNRFLYYGGWAGHTLSETWELRGDTWTLLPDASGRSRAASRGVSARGSN